MLKRSGMLLALAASMAYGQGGRGPQAPRTATAAALYDITGYWVAVVTEDWRPTGDVISVLPVARVKLESHKLPLMVDWVSIPV